MGRPVSAARPVLFLTDYGLEEEYVGVCHAVVARVAPDVRVIDLAHGIPRHDALRGALALAAAVPHAPEDAVYLAVVDPGVGTDRRAVALAAGGAHLVGPDTGLLSLAADALGGVSAAVALDTSRAPSATFHGRDVFAPAAARLARGEPLDAIGAAIDPSSLTTIRVPPPEIRAGVLRCEVLAVDRFGNVQLAAREQDLARAELDGVPGLELRTGLRAAPLVRARTFADVPADGHGLLTDSAGWLAVVRNAGDAAASLGLVPGEAVVLAAPGFG